MALSSWFAANASRQSESQLRQRAAGFAWLFAWIASFPNAQSPQRTHPARGHDTVAVFSLGFYPSMGIYYCSSSLAGSLRPSTRSSLP